MNISRWSMYSITQSGLILAPASQVSVSGALFCMSSILFAEQTRFHCPRVIACVLAPYLDGRTTFGKLDEEKKMI